jgi:hypothetical protein
MLSCRRIFLSLAACSAAALMVAGTAGSGSDRRPRTDPVLVTFSFSPVDVKQRTCQGQDGAYLEQVAVYVGSGAGDPRLSGRIELRGRFLINLVTGLGTSTGSFTISDPGTGRKKAAGTFDGVFTEGTTFHGFLVAKVRDPGSGRDAEADDDESSSGATWYGGIKSVLNPATGAITGQIGGAGDPRNPSVVQSGRCSGPFTDTV